MGNSFYLVVLCLSSYSYGTTNPSKHHVLHRLGTMITKVNNVYLVTDNARTTIELSIPIPAVDWAKVSSCKNHTDDQLTPLKNEERKYFKKILAELNIKQPEAGNGTAGPGVIDECTSEGAECIIKPVQVVGPDKSSMVYLPCSNPGSQYLASCGGEVTNSELTQCCPLQKKNSLASCNTDAAVVALSQVLKWKSANSRNRILIDGVSSYVRRIRSICLIVTHKTGTDGLEQVGNDRVESILHHVSGKPLHTVLQVKNRAKRSNLRYYLSGGPLTSSYIDQNIKRIEDSNKLSFMDLTNELHNTENAILSVKTQRDTLKEMNNNLCAAETAITATVIKNELLIAQNKLFEQTEDSVNTCETQSVPPSVIENTLLESLCKLVSDSSLCWSLHVRLLFSCKLEAIHYDQSSKSIKIQFTVSQQVPIEDVYHVFQITSIPVFQNLGEGEGVIDSTQTPTVATASDDQVAAELVKLLKNRHTRSVENDQMVMAKELIAPKYVIGMGQLVDSGQFNSVYAFDEDDCTIRGSITICKINDSSSMLKQCGLSLLNLVRAKKDKPVMTHCTTKAHATSATCVVRGLLGGYLISTKHKVSIVNSKPSNTKRQFFEEDETNSCTGICYVGTNVSQQFSCGGQIYHTRTTQHRELDLKTESIKTDFGIHQLRIGDSTNEFAMTLGNLLGSQHISKIQYLKDFFTVVSLLWWTIVICYVLSKIVSRSRIWKNVALKWKRSRRGALPNPLIKQYKK